jgi:hypothetical protein
MNLIIAFHKFAGSPKIPITRSLQSKKGRLIFRPCPSFSDVVTVTKLLSGFQKNILDTLNDLNKAQLQPYLRAQMNFYAYFICIMTKLCEKS